MFSSASSTSQSSDSSADMTHPVWTRRRPGSNSGNRDDLVTEVGERERQLRFLVRRLGVVHVRAARREQSRGARGHHMPQRLDGEERHLADQNEVLLASALEVTDERAVVRSLEHLDEAAALETDEDSDPADAV